MSDTKFYRRGIPTAPDVTKLLDKFGDPKEGDVIQYKDVCELLSVKFDSHRFKVVTHAWRKRLWIEKNIYLICIPAIGFTAANPPERLTESLKKQKTGMKFIKKSRLIALTTDSGRLTPDQIKQQDFLVKKSAILELHYEREVRRISNQN